LLDARLALLLLWNAVPFAMFDSARESKATRRGSRRGLGRRMHSLLYRGGIVPARLSDEAIRACLMRSWRKEFDRSLRIRPARRNRGEVQSFNYVQFEIGICRFGEPPSLLQRISVNITDRAGFNSSAAADVVLGDDDVARHRRHCDTTGREGVSSVIETARRDPCSGPE
jgi:hypothetical protein